MIKKILTSSIIASSLLFGASDSSVNVDKFKNIKVLSNFVFKDIKDLGSLYQVKGGFKGKGNYSHYAFITKDLNYVVFGEGINTITDKQLKIASNMSIYDQDSAFDFGNGTDEYYVFTDPECPFCKKFEKIMFELKDKAKFHIYLFPLSFHKNSKSMCLYTLSQEKEKRADVIKKIMLDNDLTYKNSKIDANAIKLLEKEQSIAKELGVSGTPAIFNSKGTSVNWTNLVKKYHLQLDLDKRAIKYIEKQKLSVQINDGNKENIYAFINLDSKKDISYINSKKFRGLMQSYNVFVVPSGFSKTTLLYNIKDAKKEFFPLANKVLTKEDYQKIDSLLDKSKSTNVTEKIMASSFLYKQLDIKTPSLYTKQGKAMELNGGYTK